MAKSAANKKQVDIEKLLQWAYLDELSKRQRNATGETWNRLSQYGFLGGVDIDEPTATFQRYAYVGEPHADALVIEDAIGRLPDMVIDRDLDRAELLGNLAALLPYRPAAEPKSPRAGWFDWQAGERRKWTMIACPPYAPRDVIAVGTIRVDALVVQHAAKATRPALSLDLPRPHKLKDSEEGSRARIVGECRGRNRYTTGSYCPLVWLPSPALILFERADYAGWHAGLCRLAQTLELTEHIALPPSAPARPWEEPPCEPPCVHVRPRPLRERTLPLRQPGPLAGPPPRVSAARRDKRTGAAIHQRKGPTLKPEDVE